MRLTSQIWVSALLRRVHGQGDYAVIGRKGAAEAGAVFVRNLHRDGTYSLFGPAPQSFFDTEKPEDRTFELRLDRGSEQDTVRILDREIDFDRDLWVVELETDTPEVYVPVTPA